VLDQLLAALDMVVGLDLHLHRIPFRRADIAR